MVLLAGGGTGPAGPAAEDERAVGPDERVQALVGDRRVEQALLRDLLVRRPGVHAQAGEPGPVGEVDGDAAGVAEPVGGAPDVGGEHVRGGHVGTGADAVERGEVQVAHERVVGAEPRPAGPGRVRRLGR